MLLSLVCATSNVYNWIYHKHMARPYIQLINNCLQHHCSVIVRHLPRTSSTVTALVRHKQHKDVKHTVLVTSKQFELSSVEPQISLSITDWARLWIDQKNIYPTVQGDVFVSLDLDVTNTVGQCSSTQEVPIGELCDIIASQQNVADECVNVIGKCSAEKFLRLVNCFLSNSRLLLRCNNTVSVVNSVTTVQLTGSCSGSDNHKVMGSESKQPSGQNGESPVPCIDKLKLNTDTGTVPAVPAKPPNIVIYCGKKDSSRLFESVKSVICQCINTSRYTVYHLKHEQVATVPWNENVVLLIVASDKVYDGVDRRFLEYFQQGGRLISFGSAFDSLLVRRKDRVVDVKSLGVLTLSFDGFDDTSVICSQYCYDNASVAMATSDDVKTVVLGTDRSTQQAVVVSVVHAVSNGRAILSQVNFDKDPVEMAISTEVFALLKRCNPMRFQILTDLLSRLGVDCSKPEVPALTPVYLLSKTQTLRTSFLDSLKFRLCDGCLTSKDLVLKFTDADDAKNSPISAKRLPVVTSSHCSRDIDGFNTSVYCEHLSTAVLGNTIMFADVISTTMTLFDGLMFSCPSDVGLIAIARRQLSGQGRGGNVWLSPLGCAMFSLHVRVPLYSELGQRATYVQHLMALAVVLAVRHKPGCQSMELCIKWPNDIYFGRDVKLGGIIVRSTIMDGVIHANIGCGVNVTNKDPTMCINDIISRVPLDGRPSAFSVEEFIARTVTTFEQLVNEFQSGGPQTFLEKYYSHWLHSGAKVTLDREGGPLATVVGLDDYGYLLVRLDENGSSVSVQPDGNSYDMMKNLIAPKTN